MSTEKPDYIYHYTSAITAIEKILPSMQLKMGQLGNMNDAKESLLHISNPENYIPSSKGFHWEYYTKPIAQMVSNNVHLLCFSTDDLKTNKDGFALQRMWAQYGDINRGVCLAIDYDKFITENKEILAKYSIQHDYIKYKNNIFNQLAEMPSNEFVVNNHEDKYSPSETWKKIKNNKTFISNNFFCKNNDWGGEMEYRFLAATDNSSQIHLSINDSLQSVIFGVHFSKHLLPSVLNIIPSNKTASLVLAPNGRLVLDKEYIMNNLNVKWSRP